MRGPPDAAAAALPTAAAVAAGASCSLEAPGVLPPWTPERREPALQRGAAALYAAVALLVGLAQIHDAVAPAGRFPVAAVSRLEAQLGPFLSLNGYGLFRTMTRTRPEILVQGTVDGETWVDYEFRDKPDRLDEVPRWVQPHMPRLDWRLWFEALAWEYATSPPRPYQPSDWFASFLERLREGEPAVVGLLASDPFDGRPPQSVRATLYDYRFADPAERQTTGHWWVRQPLYPSWLTLSR